MTAVLYFGTNGTKNVTGNAKVVSTRKVPDNESSIRDTIRFSYPHEHFAGRNENIV
jgi:hypothetical protein